MAIDVDRYRSNGVVDRMLSTLPAAAQKADGFGRPPPPIPPPPPLTAPAGTCRSDHALPAAQRVSPPPRLRDLHGFVVLGARRYLLVLNPQPRYIIALTERYYS